ncbi:hypothetical protein H8S95_14960 [Pontibacter sp. KCTC 32443]|uniref:hypothetical protein n=1 Tax=Pontibacter TaxID=323449 RepID=UPI00164CFFFA|nr:MULTISPECIES: hypothetical protein [Pontibacter]MBC5775378.1 hypothetical protein [Pontibacter sp. KCTC 32443]
MKLILSIVVLFSVCFYCKAQTSDFDSLVVSFGTRVGPFFEDSISVPSIYKGKDFNISLADSSIGFKTKTIVINSPNPNSLFPLSYSVIYKGHVISLFEPGHYACFRLSDFSRNKNLEAALNKRKFKAHWLIDNKLYGLSKGRFWYLNSSNNWIKTQKLPLKVNSKSHLYENKDYIVFSDCNGEWGGTVYFYNRETKETYFTEATCANTVTKDEEGFKILSHLGHEGGSADLKLVPDPTKLTNLKNLKTKRINIETNEFSNSTKHVAELFDFYWIQLFSSFEWEDKILYVVHWQNRTFLAEINGNKVLIVDPLFNSDLYTHEPITKKYASGEIFINLDDYGTAVEREISMILIRDKEIIKIDWNKKH